MLPNGVGSGAGEDLPQKPTPALARARDIFRDFTRLRAGRVIYTHAMHSDRAMKHHRYPIRIKAATHDALTIDASSVDV